MTEVEKEIRSLNFIILEQKDHINALAHERNKYKAVLEKILGYISKHNYRASMNNNGFSKKAIPMLKQLHKECKNIEG